MKAPTVHEAAAQPAEPGDIGMTIVVVLLVAGLLAWLGPLVAEQIRKQFGH